MIAISVVIPCKQEARSLGACLEALRGQDLLRERFEIIVVDGGSKDGSAEMARSSGARVMRDDGRGPAAARNRGVQLARGRIIAFTDADCVPRYDWLSSIEAVFREEPDLGGVGGALRMPRRTLLARLEDNDARAFYRGLITSNVAYRRDVILAVGGFDEGLDCCEDYDLAWRILDAGHKVVHDPRPIVLHDPPEIDEGLGRYLEKQFWYARHDVPAHFRALRRAASSRSASHGTGAAIAGSLQAARNSVCVGLLAAGAVARSPGLALAGLGGAALWSAYRVARSTLAARDGLSEIPAHLLIDAAKALVRGAGTIVGLAELSRAQKRSALSAPAPAVLVARREAALA